MIYFYHQPFGGCQKELGRNKILCKVINKISLLFCTVVASLTSMFCNMKWYGYRVAVGLGTETRLAETRLFPRDESKECGGHPGCDSEIADVGEDLRMA